MSKKIAVIGAGAHFKKNIHQAIVETEDLDLLGILNSSTESTQAVAKETNSIAYQSIEELLNDSSDVVYIATPPSTHYEYAKKTLEAGKHVWLEKTFVTKQEDWQDLFNIAMDKSLACFECFMFIYHPQFNKVKEIIKSQKYGRAMHAIAKFGFPHRPKDDFRYNKSLGGGALLDAGCYTVKLFGELFGVPLSTSQRIITEDGYDVDTKGSAYFKYGNLGASLAWGMGLEYQASLDIWFESGRLVTERIFSKPADLATSIEVASQSQGNETFTLSPANHFVEMFTNFLSLQENEGAWKSKMESDLEHGRLLLSLLL